VNVICTWFDLVSHHPVWQYGVTPLVFAAVQLSFTRFFIEITGSFIGRLSHRIQPIEEAINLSVLFL
jgi:hypothetical protein